MSRQWDIFCQVIDNFGDIGVCWRLTADLASRGQQVRLWVDDASALQWMAPGALQGHWAGITVLPWLSSQDTAFVSTLASAQVWIEGFGCTIPEEFVQLSTPPIWVNLEYLSAEPYVERCHSLPSLVTHGAAKGASKHFFYPGFTSRTGGLLREAALQKRQQQFDATAQAQWLEQWGIHKEPEGQLVSLFCYEPAALPALLQGFAQRSKRTHLLVTFGRATAAVQACINQQIKASDASALSIHYLPQLTQTDFDHLLWACDVNFVRGEDSLVRAIWAGKPFVWQIYPQDDAAHHAKLDAFLHNMQASQEVQQLHFLWNGLENLPDGASLNLPDVCSWNQSTLLYQKQLYQQPDLTSQLLEFVHIKSQSGIK